MEANRLSTEQDQYTRIRTTRRSVAIRSPSRKSSRSGHPSRGSGYLGDVDEPPLPRMLRGQAQAGLIQLGRCRGGRCGGDVDGSRLARARPDSGSTAVLDHTTVLVENSQPDFAAPDHLDGLLVVDEHRVVTGAVVGVEEVGAHFL